MTKITNIYLYFIECVLLNRRKIIYYTQVDFFSSGIVGDPQ